MNFCVGCEKFEGCIAGSIDKSVGRFVSKLPRSCQLNFSIWWTVTEVFILKALALSRNISKNRAGASIQFRKHLTVTQDLSPDVTTVLMWTQNW